MPRQSNIDGISVWEWPGGEPDTLLMHGIGNYGRYWDFFADAVRERLHLVAPDARGHGDSIQPPEGYSPDDFVADAVRVIDAKGLERPLVVGHSMGGFHATALTLAHPDRVRGLVLVDVGPRVERAGGERARRMSLERPDRFADNASALAYLRETSPGYSDAVYANRMEWVFKRDGMRLVWRSSKEALRQIFEGRPGHSGHVWERLGEIRVPVLIVRGTRSLTFSAETAKQMTETLPDARVLDLDAAHNVALDRPRELAEAVVSFAREID
ncbi:MAG TPA: alpha/beta hydrolase [Candidatus Limnocylindrales bacterium]|nr:alpha/beta hydrolase [Candidatus Limnocylindrales bacterium]